MRPAKGVGGNGISFDGVGVGCSSIIADATSWGKAKGLNINWVEFTDRWRLGYVPAMDKVRKGEIPWANLDDLNRMILEDLLKQYKIEGLNEEEKAN